MKLHGELTIKESVESNVRIPRAAGMTDECRVLLTIGVNTVERSMEITCDGILQESEILRQMVRDAIADLLTTLDEMDKPGGVA